MGQGGGGDMGQGGGGDMGQGGGGDMGQGGGGQWKSTYSLSPYVPSTIPVTIVGPVVIAQKRINFRIQLQEESEWCWAAVAASIEKYFNPRSAVEQCNVVNRVLQTSSNDFDDGCSGGCDDCKCCCHPDSDICNTPAQLADALQEIYKWRATLPRPLRFDEVQREIDGGRPIGVGITWASGNSTPNGTSSNPQPKGHFVVVRGYRVLSSGARQVYVADPLNASGLVDFDEFTLAYYGDGAWTETDLVQRGWA
jgi:hypothetical protein